MKLLKAQEMMAIDLQTITSVGIPSLVLMERAGLRVVEVIQQEFPKCQRVLVIGGKGNNAGDGLVIARNLYLRGYQVDYILPLGAQLKGDAQVQLQILQNLGISPRESWDISTYELIVDALLGTGFTPPMQGIASAVIEQINSAHRPVVAVDVPSGLSADRGTDLTPSVQATVTVTFQFPKLCHVLYPASKHCGKVYVADIGIPCNLAQHINREVVLKVDIPPRPVDAHKGTMGHVLLIGGSIGKTGAVILAGKASTRTGAGLVTVAVPQNLNYIMETNLIEEMSIPLPGENRLAVEAVGTILEIAEKFSAIALGMGMDRYPEGREIVRELILNLAQPLLLDADALNNLADLGTEILQQRQGVTVLTPHVGECQRLSGLTKSEIIENLTDVAQELAVKWNCYLVLKSARTAIATPEGKVYLSIRGSSAMAKGGTGDVLAGMLTALLGRGLPIETALKLGVFLHGVAGEIVSAEKHIHSLRAIDLVKALPKAYRLIEQENQDLALPPILTSC